MSVIPSGEEKSWKWQIKGALVGLKEKEKEKKREKKNLRFYKHKGKSVSECFEGVG